MRSSICSPERKTTISRSSGTELQSSAANAQRPIEAMSGLEPWQHAELPEPPRPTGLGWLKAVGPGVIVLGVSIGSGEFLLGPAAFVRHGLSLLWVVGHRRLPPDGLQHGGDALHAGDRRAGVHGLHADAPLVHALGVGVRRALLPAGRVAGLGRRGGRRPSSSSSRGDCPGHADAATIYSIGVGRVSRCASPSSSSGGASSGRSRC